MATKKSPRARRGVLPRRGLLKALAAICCLLLAAAPAWAAWTHQGNRVSATEKTSDGSISASPSSELPVGSVILVRCTTDNAATTAGQTTTHTVSDSASNTWTRIREETFTAGAAEDGVTNSLWISGASTDGQLTSAIGTGGSITCSISSNVTAKALLVDEFSVGSAKTASIAGHNGGNNSGTTACTITLSGLASAEYLWVGSCGKEGPNGDSFSGDADYTALTNTGTTGAGAASNVYNRAQFRIFTGGSDTWNASSGTGRDTASMLAAIQEVDEGAPPPCPKTLLLLGVGCSVFIPSGLSLTRRRVRLHDEAQGASRSERG